jgi:PKD repeat protein
MMRRTSVACVLAALGGALGPGCQKEEPVTLPTLSATCDARPSSGPAPLAVNFILQVAGADGAFTVAVSYGDGTSGANPDAPHTYTSAGVFTASFNVTTATQSARCSTTVTVSPGGSATPPPGSNQAPHAVFKTTPDAVGNTNTISGTAPLAVRFNLCATTDPEGDLLWFLMDFDGDGAWDSVGTTGAKCRRDAVYTAGTYDARVCVHDIDKDGQPLHAAECKRFTVVATP